MDKPKLHYGWIVILMGLLVLIGAHGFGRMSYTLMPVGADPLMPPGQDEPPGPDEYERAQAPVYAFLYALAQAGVRNDAASPSARIWAARQRFDARGATARVAAGVGGASRRRGRREWPRARPRPLGPLARRDREGGAGGDGRGRRAPPRRRRARHLRSHASPRPDGARPRVDRRRRPAPQHGELGALALAARRQSRRQPVLARHDGARGRRGARARARARRAEPLGVGRAGIRPGRGNVG